MTTILLDGRHIQDHFPGIGRYVFNLARSLAQAAPENQVRLLINPHLINTRFEIPTLAAFGNVELIRVDAGTWSLGEQLLGFNSRVVGEVSLWHSPYYLMPYLLPMPYVVTLEDIMPLVVRESMPRAASRMMYRVLNLAAARKAAGVITLSHASAVDIERVLGLPSTKIAVIVLASAPEFCPRGEAEITSLRGRLNLPERYALYIGSNKPHKNLARLVRAWASVSVDASLVIAGHWEPGFPEVKQLVQHLNLNERVVFIENVSTQELPVLMSSARVFVFPSLYEGFGLPPLEAMSCGTPVVCSNTSSLPEVVGDAALLFNPIQVDEIAAALTRVLEDEALRDKLRERGLERAKLFSWERTAQETWQVYRKVIGGRGEAGGKTRNGGAGTEGAAG